MESNNNTMTFNGTVYFTNNGHYGKGVSTVNGYTVGGGVVYGTNDPFSPFCLTQLCTGRTIMQV